MGLEKFTQEQIDKMSMIELAIHILSEQKKEMDFRDLFDMVAQYKNFTEQQKEDLLARFYTDLNVDGRFTTLGNNLWGLKRWYPVDQTSEKSLAEQRRRDAEELDEDDEFYDEEEDFYDDELDDLDLDLGDDEAMQELYDDLDDYA